MKFAIRLYLIIFGVLVFLAFQVTGHVRPDQLARCAILASFMYPIAFLPFAIWGKYRATNYHGTPLFHWPTGDICSLADACMNFLILGMIGSGKTSSSGRTLAKHLVGLPGSGGIIFASNPSDKEDFESIFADAGRSGDLIYFSPTSKNRWNLAGSLKNADALELTHFFVTVSECLIEEKKPEDAYWKELSERMLENGIRALLMAGEAVNAPNLSKLLNSAAYTPADATTDEFKKGFSAARCWRRSALVTTPVTSAPIGSSSSHPYMINPEVQPSRR